MSGGHANLGRWVIVCGLGALIPGAAMGDEDLLEAQRQVQKAERDLRRAERYERDARRDLHHARNAGRSYWVYSAPSSYQESMYRSESQSLRLASLAGERDRLLNELDEIDPYLAQIEQAADEVQQALGSVRERHAAAIEAARARAHARPEYVDARRRLEQSEEEVRAAVSDALSRLEATETYQRLFDRREAALRALESLEAREDLSPRDREVARARVEELDRALGALRERFLDEDWRAYAARQAHSRAFNDLQAMEEPLIQEELARDENFDALDRELADLRREAATVDRDLQDALRRREAIVRNLQAVDTEMDRTYQDIIAHDAYVRDIEIRRMRDARMAAEADWQEDLARDRAYRARVRADRAEDRVERARRNEEREARETHLSPNPPRVNPAPAPSPAPRVEPQPARRVEPQRQPARRIEPQPKERRETPREAPPRETRRRSDDEDRPADGPQPETAPPPARKIMPK